MPILRKQGKSVGTIIPLSALSLAGFSLGDKLEIEASDGRIILTKAIPSYSLEQLLEGVTAAMISQDQEDLNWIRSAVGKELV